MVKLVDTLVLGTNAFKLVGSSPTLSTKCFDGGIGRHDGLKIHSLL